MKKYLYMLIAVLQNIAVKGQGPASLYVTNVQVGSTASFVCSFPDLSIPVSMGVYKDDAPIYSCTNIAFTCKTIIPDPDYLIVNFTDLGTPLARGTFTVANVNKARDEGAWKCRYGTSPDSDTVHFDICDAPDVTDNCMVTSNSTTATYMPKGGYTLDGYDSRTCDSGGKWSGSTPTCKAPAVLRVQDVVEGETATFECSYSSIASTSLLEIKKDGVLIYDCVNIAFTCSALSRDTDYSDVTFTGIGTPSGKGTFTLNQADQARDGGSWVCKYGSSIESVPVIFGVNANSTCNDQTTPLLGLSEKHRIGLIAGGVGVVVVICCSICICAIMRRNINKKKRKRRQERRKASEANANISESL